MAPALHHYGDDKQRVQDATDIVGLIGEHLALRPAGKEFKGLCPFHEDRNPSMSVSPQKQIYKCFVCGAGGDVFSFVMNYHKMEFIEALKYLAGRAGVELTPFKPRGAGDAEGRERGPTRRQRIEGANAKALGFYRALLKHPDHGRAARQCVQRRGISDEMVERFQLGAAPDKWDGLATTIEARGWPRDDFELAGLINARKRGGGDYDRLRHRLIFPIADALGRPIAFGGRKLREADEPKYLNSPETPLFNKSATLYGLDLAKKPIIDAKAAVIVEGYTDVIACHQAGIRNAVATLGTAFTADHARQLRRYADRVVLIFDPDEAGQRAADRAVEVFLTGELDVAITALPEGLDPADLLARSDGARRWEQAVAGARDALAYQFDRLAGRLEEAQTITGRQRVVDTFLDKVVDLGLMRTGQVRRAFVVHRLAELTHVSEPAVQRLLARRAAARPTSRGVPAGQAPALARQAAPAAPAGQAPDPAGPPVPEDPLAPPSDIDPGDPPQPQAPPAPEPENDFGSAVATGHGRHRLKAIDLAERQIMGWLIQRPGLFHHDLPDGRAFDEALAVNDFQPGGNRELFTRIYNRLADGEELSLAGLLGDLAAEGRQDLSDLATAADAEAGHAAAASDDPRQVEAGFTDLCQRHRAFQDDRDFADHRGRMIREASEKGGDVKTNADLLERVRERHAARDDPARIARLRPSNP